MRNKQQHACLSQISVTIWWCDIFLCLHHNSIFWALQQRLCVDNPMFAPKFAQGQNEVQRQHDGIQQRAESARVEDEPIVDEHSVKNPLQVQRQQGYLNLLGNVFGGVEEKRSLDVVDIAQQIQDLKNLILKFIFLGLTCVMEATQPVVSRCRVLGSTLNKWKCTNEMAMSRTVTCR